MYVSNCVAERIKKIAQEKKITVKKVLSDVGLNYNMMSNLKTSFPKADNLAKIADYLDCSVDYLLGRTENPAAHKGGVSFGDLSNNSGIVGNVGSTINGVAPLSDNATAMLEIFNTLDIVSQAELLVHANKLKKGEQK